MVSTARTQFKIKVINSKEIPSRIILLRVINFQSKDHLARQIINFKNQKRKSTIRESIKTIRMILLKQ